MPGSLTHSPADIARRLLISLGLGSDPSPTGTADWSVYVGAEPQSPDNCITLFDTEGRISGNTQPDGEIQEYHGLQIRVRGADYATGYTRARRIAVALDTDVERDSVTISSNTYCACSVTRVSDVIHLGQDKPASRRQVFVINALANVRPL